MVEPIIISLNQLDVTKTYVTIKVLIVKLWKLLSFKVKNAIHAVELILMDEEVLYKFITRVYYIIFYIISYTIKLYIVFIGYQNSSKCCWKLSCKVWKTTSRKALCPGF